MEEKIVETTLPVLAILRKYLLTAQRNSTGPGYNKPKIYRQDEAYCEYDKQSE
jgi:hypothetical protein